MRDEVKPRHGQNSSNSAALARFTVLVGNKQNTVTYGSKQNILVIAFTHRLKHIVVVSDH